MLSLPVKKYTESARKDNFISDYDNHAQWCENCVYFGSFAGCLYWLCARHYFEITKVGYCGHCDEFSDTKKINPIKYWLLKRNGFQFKNKVR